MAILVPSAARNPPPTSAGVALALLFVATTAFAGSQVTATHAALATPSPAATQLGLRVLQGGGNAIDAAVAVSFALAVLKPEATGIGGGGFLTYYDAETGGVWTLDFREVSPAAAKLIAREGVAAAAVPGFVAGLEAMHGRFGSRPWRELVAPAASQAKDDLAKTLAQLAERGPRDFYEGDLARKIVDGTHSTITARDLREYKAVWRAPVRIAFRGADVYTVPPPAAGGVVIGSILKIVSGLDLRTNATHLLVEAERRAAIDRDRWLSDPAAGAVTLRDFLSDEHTAALRGTIDPKRVTPTITVSEPAAPAPAAGHTVHVSIIDARGNAVSLTTSLGDDRGSGFVVPGTGILLNNALRDFSATATSPNALAGSKRPASPLAPAIVMRGGKPLLAIGTGGGATIATTIAQILVDTLAMQRPLRDAIEAPRYSQQALPDEVSYERDRAPAVTINALIALGHGVNARELIGDVQAVLSTSGKLLAISDSRGTGAAGGY